METLLQEIVDDYEKGKMKNYLIDFFRREENKISIEEKINYTAFIINNRNNIIDLEEFYEEECQLAIINWVFYNRKQLEVGEHSLLGALLYNLLIILEIFPIKTSDFISLKIVEKLNSIRRSVKKTNKELANRIEGLVSYWKSIFTEMKTIRDGDQFLHKKRLRDKNAEDQVNKVNNLKKDCSIDQLETCSDLDSYDTKYSESSIIINKHKDKKVTWKENIVEEITFMVENPLSESFENKQE